MSERIPFDESTALTKVGQRIKTLVEFSGVPRGTFGEVTRADRSAEGVYPGDSVGAAGTAREAAGGLVYQGTV